MVKNLPAVQETQVQSLDREDPPEKEMMNCLPTARSSHSENDFTYSGPGPKKNCKGCESPSNLGEFCTFHSLK